MSDDLLSTPDTGPVKLPALVFAPTGNAATDQALSLMKEHLEMRSGGRGNPWERAVTVRDIQGMQAAFTALQQPKQAKDNEMVLDLGAAGSASVAVDKFIEAIKKTKLFKDMLKSLDDPTRFDDLPAEIRDIVSKSVAEAALEQGTKITQVKKLIEDRYRKLAYQVDEMFTALDGNAAGIRETKWVIAETNFAQAGYIKQLQASLGKYYQDGSPGRASLEEQMTVTADRVAGLRSQYTLKVQAGGALAGFGLSASEANGVPQSAFIISADKFAIVAPTYNGGMTNTPALSMVPFGVDANGIYMNTGVYIKGTMRVDTGGKTLIQGLRGSVNIGIYGSNWSDAAARSAVWQQLGNGGSATSNNHLVIGDQVMISDNSGYSVARMWNGSSWANPGVIINGDMVVDGSLSAEKIDTRGLDIRDAYGNVIFSSGTNLNVSRITGLGTLAKQNSVDIGPSGGTVTLNGTTFRTSDFVNRLSKINNTTIGTFMESAAIGNAYIGNAAVNSLKIQGQEIIVPRLASGADQFVQKTSIGINAVSTTISMGSAPTDGSPSGGLLGLLTFFMETDDDAYGVVNIHINGSGSPLAGTTFGLRVYGGGEAQMKMPVTVPFLLENATGSVRVDCYIAPWPNGAGDKHNFYVRSPKLILFGGKR